ncbi:MAG: glycoside hydrolase family 32 protein [Bacteroidetes bacterium]|nr:glycoside hydrolase family 32 protein [Bacteroidota bacterium]MDA1120543.1 glycoside hydrolase family 32 protein [Bacteroidota bacterium]
MKRINKLFISLLQGTLLVLLVQCQQADSNKEMQTETGYYQEQYRPQFHFSPESGWMNDPNGMFYYDGEYHLFYQHYPDSTVWGPMHWAHAVSTDMVSWEHLPIGLYPDDLGYIFSGSAVVDWKNTTGFGSEDNPPMVAIFTHHSAEGSKAGRTDYQNQSIAYSLDKGRTWTKYEGNPVLPNQGIKDFRDPKVSWHEASQKWVMILAVWDHVELYGSPDLKSWNKLSDFGLEHGNHGGVWECPDLFELPIEGSDESRWVMFVSIGRGGPNKGSATQYFIGQFDGQQFTNENSKETELWVDAGPDNYAGVTWSDIPKGDGRRLFIGWMSNWEYAQVVPTEKWRSAMTVARALKLQQTDAGLRMTSSPVQEFIKVRAESNEISTQAVSGAVQLENISFTTLSDVRLEFTDFVQSSEFGLKLSNEAGEEVLMGYSPKTGQFFIDRSKSGISDFHELFARRQTAERSSASDVIKLRILLDASSIELFGDEGSSVMTALVFPTSAYTKVSLFSKDGSAQLTSGQMSTVNSIW